MPLRAITNNAVRQWVTDLLTSGLSAATTRKAGFALRQCLAAAIADNRRQLNPATAIPLPTERQKSARYLSQPEVERLVDEMPRQCRALAKLSALPHDIAWFMGFPPISKTEEPVVEQDQNESAHKNQEAGAAGT